MDGIGCVDAPPPRRTGLDIRSDQELIAAVNAGDAEAFGLLYQRYRGWVMGLATRLTRDEWLALDVLQETFLYFLKRFPGFILTCQLKTFLYPVVNHCAAEARRKARRSQSDEAEQAALEGLTVPPGIAGGHEGLDQVLAALSEAHREVLFLRFVDGLSLEETARAQEVALGTVKSRLHYALDLLRRNPGTRELLE
jgi:RNA polymerase sigma-70 factor (ECF subfamily)